MGQCLSAPAHDTPDRFKGRWQQGGLADGLSAFGGLGEPGKPAYTTTADVGLGPKGDQFGFLHDKAPAPLQLERIDEDATLQGGPESSPLKPASAAPAPDAAARVARKPINWTRGELVGQGAFGSVFVAMDNDTGELIAVKQVHIPRGGGVHAKKVEDNIRSVEEEVQLLQQFDHDNIVRYLGTEKTDGALNIFLEYVPGGSIASLLAKFGSFKESVIRVYTKQILLGLEYLHSKGVMHRDIKGANILVDNTGLVKVADFGASKKLEDLVTVADGNKSVKGTPYWMAPEVITQTGHGRQADLWSVACTVLEMATGRPPWSTQYPSQVAAMFHIASTKGPPEIPQHLSPECKDFLYLCFNRDWKARPLASTLLRHPFLADVPLRSQGGGPSPNAAALAQACRMPRSSSGGSAAAAAAMGGPEPGDGQFGTPSPLNPKQAAPRISVQAGDGAPSDSTAALSPLGHHAASRQQQWDSAAAPTPQQQQQQQQAPAHSGRMTGSPVKRPAMSLRASAPAFSGYASVALSQQAALEPLAPLPGRAAAAPAQQVQQSPSAHRGSKEGSSMLITGGGEAGADAARPEREASSPVLPAEAEAADPAPSHLVPEVAEGQQEQVAAGEAGEDGGGAGDAAGLTPAGQRQRAPATTPHSIDTSSGTSKSDYNPMEEPSWMHPLESPLAGEGTPTSALTTGNTADGTPEQAAGGGGAAGGQEASSYPAALPAGEPAVAGVQAAAAAPGAGAEQAAGAAAPSPPPPAVAAPVYAEHPSADHMVWTNEDGDIDALPWDMGGWSAGSSGQREGGEEGEAEAAAAGPDNGAATWHQQLPAKQPADPVDEDALIGALRRKAQHDVRASLILFEKSMNIPAVHPSASPKAAAAAAASPPGAAPTVRVAQAQQGKQAQHVAESIESRGSGGAAGGGRREQRQLHMPQPAAAGGAPVDDSWRRAAAAQHVMPAAQEPSAGALPPVAPLAAAMGGLTRLGFGNGRGGGGGGDRESIWQQELSQELFRVKAGTGGGGGVPNRRISLHGSPLKRPGGAHP